jgi:ArsR family transcriptional regulator
MKASCFTKGSRNYKKIVSLKTFMEVLNDVNRLRILCILKPGKEMCVCDIFKALDLPQNLVSYHLSMLKNIDVLVSRKEGNRIIYRRNDDTIDTLLEVIKQL